MDLLASPTSGLAAQFWFSVAIAGIGWNVAIAIFNLFPILPLDGGRIVTSLLPNRMAYSYSRLEPYGLPILIGLILLMNVYQPLGMALFGLMDLSDRFFLILFGLQ